TTGEGGAVGSDDPVWARAISSLREWGRDCWCPPGVNDACGRRFDGQFGDLPAGYDHKYVFSHLGFNFKVTDMQAALGLAQLERRVVGELTNADKITESGVWVGVYPGLTGAMIDWIAESIADFLDV